MTAPYDTPPKSQAIEVTRRGALAAIGAAAVAAGVPCPAVDIRRLRGIAIDAFVLFDPTPLRSGCRRLFGEPGDALAQLWSTKLFAYTWLLNSIERYEPFLEVARKSLLAATATTGIAASQGQIAELVEVYRHLEAWPDVVAAIQRLRSADIRVALLSNLGEAELSGNLERAGLSGMVGSVLSTDRIGRFKPAPAAYAMATEAFGMRASEIGFAAFAGWDAIGARSFGYRTAWINRLRIASETLGPTPDIVGTGMDSVLALAGLAID
jgi:2-haloacid dehalogenase